MIAAVANSDSTMAIAGMTVTHNARRKMKIVATTSPMVSSSVFSTSLTDARMVFVRSDTTDSLIALGNCARSRGSSLLMRSTVSMALAPLVSRMFRTMASRPLYQPTSSGFAGPISA